MRKSLVSVLSEILKFERSDSDQTLRQILCKFSARNEEPTECQTSIQDPWEQMLPRALQVLCCQCKNTKTIYNSLLQTFIIVFHSLCQTFLVSDFALLVTLVATILIKSYLMRRHTPHLHDDLKLHLSTLVHH